MSKLKAVGGAVKAAAGWLAKQSTVKDVAIALGGKAMDGLGKITSSKSEIEIKVDSFFSELEEIKKEIERLKTVQKTMCIVFGILGLILSVLIFVI